MFKFSYCSFIFWRQLILLVLISILLVGTAKIVAAGESSEPQFDEPPANAPAGQSTVSGWFHVTWGDGLPGSGQTEVVYSVTGDDGQTIQIVPDEMLNWPAGGPLALDRQRIELNGALLDSVEENSESLLLAQSIQAAPMAASPEPLGNPMSGSHPWLSVLCKFPDVPAEPRELSYFQDMFGSDYPGLNHYWRETSYNTIDVLGSSAVGWYTLPYPRDHYIFDADGDGVLDADLDRLAVDCTELADAEVYYPDYAGVNLMFNDNLDCCAWGGGRVLTLDGVTQSYGMTWEPPWGIANLSVIKHEMGHGFGLPHSSGDYGETYDNAWDVMSSPWRNCSESSDPTFGCLGQHTISYHKDKLGWIPTGQKHVVTNAEQGTFTLDWLDSPLAGNYKLVQIPINGSATRFYTLEARREAGYDVKLPGQGVIIHEVDLYRDRPAYVVDVDYNGETGDDGAMWTVGETFTTTHGITVTIVSSATSGFTVDVAVAAGPTYDCAAQGDIPVAECQALVSLFSDTSGGSWSNNTGWLDDAFPCDWYGVTCSAGHVDQLSLRSRQLAGTIPEALGNLSNLRNLYLDSNNISGALPVGLGSLANLQNLNLANNQLSGSIPPELGNLSNLQTIYIYNNQLTGSIPAELSNLASVRYLYLYNNQLVGSIPPELGGLTNLVRLSLFGNQLDGPIPPELGNLANLQQLILYNNQLDGPIPPELGNLAKLQYLFLQNNQLVGSIPSEFGNLSQLRYLYLLNNALEGDVPAEITNMTGLSSAGIDYNALVASDPDVSAFLHEKDLDWYVTQTVPPADVQVAGKTADSITLSWTPINYTWDGGYYEVSYATQAGGPYIVHGMTSDKYANGYVVDNLDKGLEYIFRVRTHTPAHADQRNDLWSEFGQVLSAKTGFTIFFPYFPVQTAASPASSES